MTRYSCVSSKAVAVFAPTLLLCSAAVTSGPTSVTLVATGSSLPEPLYNRWNDEYRKENPGTQVRYLPSGTAESITRILAGEGDFGGGDAPIPEKELSEASTPLLELPSVLIGIAVVYNVPGLQDRLQLSGPVLANIFLGKVTAWNDPEIAKLNPHAKLPDLPIKVIHRTAGKGSSYILSDYLSKVSVEFLSKAGRGVSPKWPVGEAVGRTPDVLEKVRGTSGAISYTELNWAHKAALNSAMIRNAAGEFVRPTAVSIEAAASALESKMQQDFRVSLTNAPGKESYPIASFTWLYVPAKAKDPERGRAVAAYLAWVYAKGQKIARAEGYAPLPAGVLERAKSKAATVH